jgi:hypothetical protein
MTDFRALCKELHAAFNTYAVDIAHHDLLERARAALAEQPVVLMDKLDRLIALDRDDPANSLPTSKK